MADAVTRKVQHHLLSVMTDVLDKEGKRPPRPPKIRARNTRAKRLRTAALNSAHSCPQIAGDFGQCRKCGCRAKASELTAFLGTPCRP
eukprot:8405703-Pyramimonas_sp.AAC.1